MKTVLRQDDSTHWYRVPKNVIDAFDSLMTEIESVEEGSDEWYDLTNRFMDLFDKYRLSGGPNSPYIG